MTEPPLTLPPDKWLTTVQAAVNDIIEWLSEDDKQELRKMSKDSLFALHFGLGGAIRNRYGLLGRNKELLIAACGSEWLYDADDASTRLVEAVWAALRERPGA